MKAKYAMHTHTPSAWTGHILKLLHVFNLHVCKMNSWSQLWLPDEREYTRTQNSHTKHLPPASALRTIPHSRHSFARAGQNSLCLPFTVIWCLRNSWNVICWAYSQDIRSSHFENSNTCSVYIYYYHYCHHLQLQRPISPSPILSLSLSASSLPPLPLYSYLALSLSMQRSCTLILHPQFN